ncbi:MAG: MFS transporter [Bacteroidales bacterium]|nr:MFS transporter [Bacteroidales bacterium]
MIKQPRLSFWQIWNMSFGFLGIQFGYALQNANVSRIFQTLGGDTDKLALYWLAAPVTGLLIQPIVGYFSDRTWNRFGRRRPYFLVGAIMASLGLLIMPNSPFLWVAVGMLWIMDASINISMEPFRAYVGDMLPSEQRTKGFVMQSFFIGISSVVASALPYIMANWIGIANTAPEGMIPPSVKISFYLGAFAFITTVLWTVFRSHEYPPEEYNQYHPAETEAEKDTFWLFQIFKDFGTMPKTMIQLAFVQFFSWFALFAMWVYSVPAVTTHLYDMKMHRDQIVQLSAMANERKAEFLGNTVEMERLTMVMRDLDVLMTKTEKESLANININLANYFVNGRILTNEEMAAELTRAASETSLPAMNEVVEKDFAELRKQMANGTVPTVTAETIRYFTQNMDQFNFDNEFKTRLTLLNSLTHAQAEYNNGADWVGVSFGGYNLFAAAIAFFLPVLARMTSRKTTHMGSLILGGIGLLSIYFLPNSNWLILSMVGVGIAWASILSMPYAILTGSIPGGKLGIYMGIFNFFIVIPQILAATILGFMLKTFFMNESIFALVIGGVAFLISAALVTIVDDVDDVHAKA